MGAKQRQSAVRPGASRRRREEEGSKGISWDGAVAEKETPRLAKEVSKMGMAAIAPVSESRKTICFS